MAEASRADALLTTALRQALALVDIRALDHMIVAGSQVLSQNGGCYRHDETQRQDMGASAPIPFSDTHDNEG